MTDTRRLDIIVPKYARIYGNCRPKQYTIAKGIPGVHPRKGSRAKIKTVPKKYSKSDRYIWKLKGTANVPTLYDTLKKEYIVANAKDVAMGHQIKAQENTTNSRQHDGIRANIFKAIKESCKPYLKGITAIPADWYPLRVDIALHDTVANHFDAKDVLKQVWDADNFASVYQKPILDLLVNFGIREDKSLAKVKGKYPKTKGIIDPTIPCLIKDDDRFYVSLPLCYWRPLTNENYDERYIKITIRPDLMARANPIFQQFHKRVQTSPVKLDGTQTKMF